jgi:hypothetical protein
MIRCSLPGDSPVGDAHYDLDVTLDFLAIDGPRAREVGVVDLVHLLMELMNAGKSSNRKQRW